MKPDTMPLGRLLAVTGRLLGHRVQRLLEDQGLSHAGWLALDKLDGSDGLTQRDLARSCFVSAATVTGIVDTLEREGLVTRGRTDADRRLVRISLTDAGRERVRAARAVVEAAIGPLFADLTPRDEAVVRRFLTRTLDRLAPEEAG